MKIKILKHGIKHNGKYIRAWYSKGKCMNYPEGTITVYAKSVLDNLPKELTPENNTDIQSDYFEKDRAYITSNHPLYNEFLKYVYLD